MKRDAALNSINSVISESISSKTSLQYNNLSGRGHNDTFWPLRENICIPRRLSRSLNGRGRIKGLASNETHGKNRKLLLFHINYLVCNVMYLLFVNTSGGSLCI